MAEKPSQGDPMAPLLADISTRLRDTDERSRLIRERVLLLGKNLIASRQELDSEIKELKKENMDMKRDIAELKRIIKSLLLESNKFARKDEMQMIERMLKDFQPLEFARKKDVEELLHRHTSHK